MLFRSKTHRGTPDGGIALMFGVHSRQVTLELGELLVKAWDC